MIPMKSAAFLAFCLLSTAMLPTSLAAKLGLGLLAVVVAIVFKHFSPRERLPIDNKSVLVTGCDTGFGLALAKHLHSLGFFVYAGCLLKNAGGNGAKELEDIDPDRLVVLQLDVTSDQQVQEAVKLILETLPDKRKGLWAVVNNAGVSSFGEVEWCTMDKYKFIYDVNVHGMIRVTKAVLPLIRKAKGRVINMASGISRHGAPSRSLYCTSKFAVQGFSTAFATKCTDGASTSAS
ncbi:D-beta-hydroxybutyrate dehydrogenase, mitochondrial-like [Ptychodera flava]|uniref:D-beta-hydroxybutyrate dehydrogenase, mitochondrial-like n=1 Tax=Ptychodera flava TaxID=63121 RepID=UPI003969D4E4